MDESIQTALSRGQLIDITTTGRQSHEPRRIEIVFHAIGGRVYVSGMAGRKRSWLANLETDPHLTFHLKRGMRADLPAVARVIVDETERRAIFREIVKVWTNQDVETMVGGSPLIEVIFPDLAA
jgi:deazaflavin-dependent oxidoreductase (nitroreductase family)